MRDTGLSGAECYLAGEAITDGRLGTAVVLLGVVHALLVFAYLMLIVDW